MVLTLRYGDLSGAASESGRLADELGQYCDDLSRKVQQKMHSVEGGMSSYLNGADYYVNQKIRQLCVRETNARALSSRTQALLDTARRVDIDVERTIQNNRKAFFDKNPELRSPEGQKSLWEFLCGVGSAVGDAFAGGLGGIINGVVELGERIKGAAAALWDGIVEAWNDGWLKTVVTIVAGVAVGIACVMTGGLLAVVGAGILAGLGGQIFSDVLSGEMSSWESYAGSAIGGGVGFLATAAGGPVLGAAVSGALSSFATGALENMTGKSHKSLGELLVGAAVSATVGAVLGLCLDKVAKLPIVQNAVKSANNALAKIFTAGAAKTGIFTGSGSFVAVLKRELTYQIRSGWTKQITGKMLYKGLVAGTLYSFGEGIKNRLEDFASEFVLTQLDSQILQRFRQGYYIPPAYVPKYVMPRSFAKEYRAFAGGGGGVLYGF
ncbi:MAG: hypothetical protein LBL83_12125 [Clostridiales bacterium]|jgi:hypothetical protein|nr:hypothetical protein [Clostridiales bacterium]